MGWRVATDIGGTFTDLAAVGPDGRLVLAKAPTTYPDFERGVLAALRRAGREAAPGAGAPGAEGALPVASFVHGTTLVINALTERRGVRTGLLTTAGFRDVLAIGRGNRPDLFNYGYRKPEPFVPRPLRLEARERLDPSGAVLEPLAEDDVRAAARAFREAGVQAVAVCFLHSYANPEHERRAGAILAEELPGAEITLSHAITREWREYERTSTAVLNAYVQPAVARYLDRLDRALPPGARRLLMHSAGGSMTFARGREAPITLVESGPVGGVLGALALGRALGEENVITLDVGGTTVKTALIEGGRLAVTTDYAIERTPQSAGYPIRVPVVDVVELGAGGGSVAWLDETGVLRVGPRSAGADPGPACYGRGGTEPTVTDAHLLAGRIDPERFLGGEMPLAPERARAALAPLVRALGLGEAEVARGILRLADAQMASALHLISVRRGYDPREYTLVAFGGAGPLHAAALGRDLRVKQVVVPPAPAHFSAWGMLQTDLRWDAVRTYLAPLEPDRAAELDAVFAALEAEARRGLTDQGIPPDRVVLAREAECRYAGQEHTVTVAVPARLDAAAVAALVEAFGREHQRRYTFDLPEMPVELVTARVTGHGLVDKPRLEPLAAPGGAGAAGAGPGSERRAAAARTGERDVDFLEAGVHRAAIYDRSRLEPGATVDGPAVVEEAASVTVVPPGCRCTVDPWGNLVLRFDAGGEDQRVTGPGAAERDDPFTLEVIKHGLAAAADEMFVTLGKSSMSPIIYEVLDYACGITDGAGRLVRQSSGITGFLASLTLTVQHVLRKFGPDGFAPGDVVLTNDPYEGGGLHLSDVAVVVPVFAAGRLVAFTVDVAHWTDLGGKDLGSWSADAGEIFQEGLRFPAVKAWEAGRPNAALLDLIRANVRTPEASLTDLFAQVAAARAGARRIEALAAKYGVAALEAAARDLLERGRARALQNLAELAARAGGTWEAEDCLDDNGLTADPVPVRVRVTITPERFVVDYTGSSPAVAGSVNCPRGSAVAAARNIFIALTDPHAPPNEGTFAPVEVVVPDGTVFSAVFPTPVSTYWESSALAEDLIWKALAPRVPHRLTAGHYLSVCSVGLGGLDDRTGRPFYLLEPTPGGWGAAADRDGTSALICSGDGETYTLPVEVAEARYPVRIRRFALNTEPGGAGRFRGGLGCVREYEFLNSAGFISAHFGRHKFPPWGVEGGRPGTPNRVEVVRRGEAEPCLVAGKLHRFPLARGDVVRLITGCGGGWGDPRDRDPARVAADVRDGLLTPEQARELYGGGKAGHRPAPPGASPAAKTWPSTWSWPAARRPGTPVAGRRS